MANKREFKQFGIVIERNTHFSADTTMYQMIIEDNGRTVCLTLSKLQYAALCNQGIPTYLNETTPEGQTIKQISEPV